MKIYPGVRYEAQGGAAVADADGIDALYWNPAGLARAGGPKIAFSHNNYIADVKLNYLAYVKPTRKNGVYGFSLLQNDAGDMTRTEVDAAGDPVTGLGDFDATDLVLAVTYARKFNGKSRVGLSGKYLYSKIDSVKGDAWAADLGYQFQATDEFSLGFAAQNIGTRMKFQRQKDELPLNYKFGAAYRMSLFSSGMKLRIGADMNIPSDNTPYYNAGFELWPAKYFALRFGYDRRNRDMDKWFTGGFGLYYSKFEFGYAYTPYGDLKHSHRIGLGYTF